MTVPAAGQYTFYTNSDDGSKLYIGSTLVVDNDGLHCLQERMGTIGLQAGTHALTVAFLQGGGDQNLTVSYQGPTLDKQPVAATALARLASPGQNRIALATSAAEAGLALQVYPNPNQGIFTVTCGSGSPQAATLLLTNSVGQLVKQQQVHLQPGTNRLLVQTSLLPQGLYQLTPVENSGQRQVQKVFLAF